MYDQDVKYKKIAIGLVALHDVNLWGLYFS